MLGLSLSLATNAAYSSALSSYISFCHAHNFDCSPTPETLLFFVTYMSAHINPQSVASYLSGIIDSLLPFYPDVKATWGSALVKWTLQGCHCCFGTPTKRKLPLTHDDLVRAEMSLTCPLLFDNLLWVVLLFMGFFGLLRLGELAWPNPCVLHDYNKLSLRSSATFGEDWFQFAVRDAKSNSRFEGDVIRIQRSALAPDPLSHFLSYLHAHDGRFPFHPHLWLRQNGSILTRSWFLGCLRSIFPTAISGHSMQAGGATSLAAAGVPPAQIQAIRRWSSGNWQHYIRKNPVLLQGLLFNGHGIHDPPFANV
ncbi:hypothetical protein BV22DRAFT_1024919 [Leucogyrophana mollusca]|uniref:Uncharacterized protein n=1 Tax=Leucogyrophana mollusca TaxID=85980 RepID=A0ACB8AXW8_9AGAM|nr:hypothetical protein BV22DRAFT_1024919 [Leucogyrophana mollusca]